MVKEKKEGVIEEADLFNIFMNEGSSQLEQQLLKSKRKLLNARRGKNELFEVLKLKSKGLDMMILILENNKEVVRNEDFYCLDTLSSLLKLARNEKHLFDTILKNIQFENSFLQQVLDKMKNNNNIFSLFTNTLFTKFFKGRNISIKVNDVKSLIRYTFTSVGPFYYLEKLIQFLLTKEKGGARTTHQINQVFTLMTYIVDLANSKLSDENISAEFKEKFISLKEGSILQFGNRIMEIIKENLKSSEEEERKFEEEIKIEEAKSEEGKKNKELKKKNYEREKAKQKNIYFFIGLINFYEKLVTFLCKSGVKLSEDENLKKSIAKLSTTFEKVSDKFELKNSQKLITEIKEKTTSLLK